MAWWRPHVLTLSDSSKIQTHPGGQKTSFTQGRYTWQHNQVLQQCWKGSGRMSTPFLPLSPSGWQQHLSRKARVRPHLPLQGQTREDKWGARLETGGRLRPEALLPSRDLLTNLIPDLKLVTHSTLHTSLQLTTSSSSQCPGKLHEAELHRAGSWCTTTRLGSKGLTSCSRL